ncbi:GNAT family N-acetyltransferase [Sporolactobacillus terrae]|uniref:N-acetyltransferase n=1 Tax=Sporolactobacillus terrae TaxID=269673 RepID=A0ABX5QAS9_9BACL|nr:GNAT family N-acetyltransferase [Sporolactobacillus terrae]QAA23696.1 N-acetyltransferase [Sporolactobacillus terrae]QAA26667.1 N-acetyltransferase [Sporolactobacillus terrae]UAK15736.1 GNAT family N-acetyltransferase [Sporolactobacillus terrae]
MIRQLTEKDRDLVMRFAGDRPAENLFIFGDIEAYGLEGECVTLWGDFDGQGALRSILLRYLGNFIPYARDAKLLDGKIWADVITRCSVLTCLSGLQNLVQKILPYMSKPVQKEQLCYYAARDLGAPLDKSTARKDVKMLFPEEAEKIIALRQTIFSNHAETPATLQKNMDQGISRTFYIERNNEPVSSVSTTAETAGAAMIVGVCTKKGYEHQGFATSCLIKTISALQAEHKRPCLFYDHPVAARIYEKLNFIPIGKWMIERY